MKAGRECGVSDCEEVSSKQRVLAYAFAAHLGWMHAVCDKDKDDRVFGLFTDSPSVAGMTVPNPKKSFIGRTCTFMIGRLEARRDAIAANPRGHML